MNVQTSVHAKPRRWPCAIDMHAHLMIPEMYRITGPHSMFVKSNTDPDMSEAAKKVVRDRDAFIESRMSDTTERLARMDAMGVDMQVLSSSLVQQCTYWAEPQESLRMERMLNERMAEVVAANPQRYIGLGGVPLHAPDLAAAELTRCMIELKLAGVGISTTARDVELGDCRLRPFWEAAEAHGAVVYIHPAGNPDRRFEKWYLWNSIGQAFEEAMAIASLFYEGILDAYPRLKICVSHGGGYMPYYMGRIARNYLDKPATRVNMSKSPAEYLRMLYFDSCVYETEVLEALVKRVGADRVLLGSDYPVGEPKPIEFIESCALSQGEKADIIGGNAARLFGVKVAA
jgi:aminocarboxymuconate-semialdehyde decarboxylase